MSKFDANDLSLPQVAIFSLIGFAVLACWIWLSGKPFEYDGARGLATDKNGVTHIQVNNTLYRYDESGAILPNIELSGLGVSEFVGDLSFNTSNQLLLRTGGYETGFLENLSILFRVSNKQDKTTSKNDSLSLCDLESMSCVRYGENAHNFNRGFFSAVDTRDDSIVFSDSSRHELHKFDKNGRKVASVTKDLEFPNGISIIDEKLYLVDTNNKVVKQLELNIPGFGELIDSAVVANPDADALGYVWPFDIVKAGQNWWVILLDNSMQYGGVYLYDENWTYVKPLALRQNALPVALLNRGDEVLVSDIENTNVKRYSLAGDLIGVVAHPSLNKQLKGLETQRDFFRQLGNWYLFAITLIIVGIVSITYLLQVRKNKNTLSNLTTAQAVTDVDINEIDSSATWMKPKILFASLRTAQIIQAVSFVAILVGGGCALFYITSYVDPVNQPYNMHRVMLLSAMAYAGILLLSELARVRIGVYKDQLILHDQMTNVVLSAPGEAVLYDGNRVAFGSLSAIASNKYYHLRSLTRHMYPILSNASTINSRAMSHWMFKNEVTRRRELAIKIGLLGICYAAFFMHNM